MFGLTQLETRLVGVAVVLTVVLVALVGFGWHERSVGAVKCERADTKAEAKQDVKDAKTLQKQQDAVISEGTNYAAIVAAPPPTGPPVWLCHDSPQPAPVPAARAARPIPDARAAVPAESGGDPPQRTDVGPDLRANTRQADAQVLGLQAYIRDVCIAR